MKRKVIVIAPHPDDETLGMGGTLLRHRAEGDDIYWLIITNISTQQGFSSERVNSRQAEIAQVAEAFGFTETIKLDFPTMSLTDNDWQALIKAIVQVFLRIQPDTIYLPNRSDAHSDHRIIFDATMACTKTFRYPFIQRIFMYETVSETDFAPALPEKVFIANYFVDITAFFAQKIAIMQIYASELAPPPFPRSIENISAWATVRGAMAGVLHAEAFQIVKWIEK
ncbi:putative LmbE-like protein [Beggiatoa alba B18LD]|uniref:Putative LmbE-like protein n=1 Tax=Beggiatoa alba B18LD TaxID=395493 RepID=I3CKB9_9GAMM|nr:PIG-L family deacetylase [Beggiatoa alba]EIJ44062.1 putative LmbE-like protein [Beggiatoa alba B18LD]